MDHWRAALLLALALLPLGLLLAWVSARGELVALRDGAHYYEPLYRWLADELGAGRWPLWNPWENAGVPLASDPTAALWYPGRAIFLLPISAAARYNVYLFVHFTLAAAGSFLWARTAGRSTAAALLATLSYVYGAPLLFQYCNVIFLVGAAWFPWGGWLVERALTERALAEERQHPAALFAAPFAAVLASMVLGGDPQAAYHLVLFASLRLLCGAPRSMVGPARTGARLTRFVVSLLAAGLLAAGLAAIQILPSWHTARASERYEVEQPASPEAAESNLSHSRPHAALADTHVDHRYDFSVAPWRLAELFWPNIGGRMFPENCRWWSALPEEGRVWCPSLYMGLLPLLLAISAARLVRGTPTTRWLTWITVLALLAACGEFGIGWLMRRLVPGSSSTGVGSGHDAVGGVYWLLLKLLPGYGAFRYPAKWSVLAALGIAQLAAQGWDDLRESCAQASLGRVTAQRFHRLLVALLMVSAAAGVALAYGHVSGRWHAWLAQAPSDSWLGPLDANGALVDAVCGLTQTTVVGLTLLALVSRPTAALGRWLVTTLGTHALIVIPLVVTAFDLTIANHWLLARVDADTATLPTTTNVGSGRTYRAYWDEWLPASWSVTRDPNRLRQSIAWERATRFPKTNLPSKTAVVSAEESLRSREWKVFFEVAAERGIVRPDRVLEPRPDLLGMLAIDTWYVPSGCELPGLVPANHLAPNIESLAIWRAQQPVARAWLVSNVDLLPPLPANDYGSLRRRTQEVFDLSGTPTAWQTQAIVEAASVAVLDAAPAHNTDPDSSSTTEPPSIRWRRDDANRIELEISTPKPMFCVLADRFDPDWHAGLRVLPPDVARQFETSPSTDAQPTVAPILRTNRLVRGVAVPTGRHLLTFTYRPRFVYLGGLISALCWFAVLGGWGWHSARAITAAVGR